MLRKILLGLVVVFVLAIVAIWVVGIGLFGRHEGPGEFAEQPRPRDVVAGTGQAIQTAADGIGVSRPRQILFGDLHVHTTLSFDAFMASLPIARGEGTHPQSDACDFARYCSALDFWSINDHAEFISPRAWRETAEAIRQCNAVAGDPTNPDTVAFLGWEWTQVGPTPDTHWGHKNVVLAHTDDARIPPRPVAVRGVARTLQTAFPGPFQLGFLALLGRDRRYHDFALYARERLGMQECEPGAYDDDCMVTAETAGELFRQLDAWGSESIVIPHGTTWGYYTPPGSSWDHQLSKEMHDPDRQTLLEIYSGHGNSEEYRDWQAVELDAEGKAVCPAPRPDYTAPCRRAGEIILERCLTAGEAREECERRAEVARRNAAEALGQAHLTVPGQKATEWLDAGQCRDCAQPAFNYRPRGSAQYMMALRNFDEQDDAGQPLRFRFGFMASSDNHFARAGTGYKEVHRRGMTESNRARRAAPGPFGGVSPEEPVAESRSFDRESSGLIGFQLFESERQSSFFLTGGLIATHSDGRDRDSIWSAMQRREVYGTSGPRMLLWFDLLNPPGTTGKRLPMGSDVELSENPIFEARAVGSFVQKPGCPDYATAALAPERLESICKGECYNPSDERRLITRIEVIRVRPQSRPGEPLAALIEDPWRVFECEPDPAGCGVTFLDLDYASDGRDALYYVRAIEEPKPGVNAASLRCEYDAQGNCISVNLCGGIGKESDDCLAEHEPRAWSSPIFVDWAGGSP
jgi:hypothetical protein